MAQANKSVTPKVLEYAERVIKLLGGGTELQRKFSFIKSNAENACLAVSDPIPKIVEEAINTLQSKNVEQSIDKSTIIDRLTIIIDFLKTSETK